MGSLGPWVLGAAAILVGLVSGLIVLRERLTRVEVGQRDHGRRLDDAEEAIEKATTEASTTREQLARLTAEVEGVAKKVDETGSVSRQVLEAVLKLTGNARKE